MPLGDIFDYRLHETMNPFSFQVISVWHHSYGAVQGMRDRGGSFLVPSEVLGLTGATDEARHSLGQRFEVLFEAGREMDPEDVFLTDGLASGVA